MKFSQISGRTKTYKVQDRVRGAKTVYACNAVMEKWEIHLWLTDSRKVVI